MVWVFLFVFCLGHGRRQEQEESTPISPFLHATSQVRYRRSQAVDAHTIYDAEAVDHQLPLVKREWVERGGEIFEPIPLSRRIGFQ